MRLIDGERVEHILRDMAKDKHNQNATTSWANALEDFAEMISGVPTIEAEPVRHGMWKRVTAYEGSDFCFYECSICGEPWWFKMNYCAKCGAKMDKVEE